MIGTCFVGMAALGAKTLASVPQLGPVDFVGVEDPDSGDMDHLPKIYQLDDGLFTLLAITGAVLPPVPCLAKAWLVLFCR